MKAGHLIPLAFLGLLAFNLSGQRKHKYRCYSAVPEGIPKLAAWWNTQGQLKPEVQQLLIPVMTEAVVQNPGATDEEVVDSTVMFFIPECDHVSWVLSQPLGVRKPQLNELLALAQSQGAVPT